MTRSLFVVVALAVGALHPGCACGEPPGSDGDGDGRTTAPTALRPVLGALCDAVERCPDDFFPMETRDRDECIDVMYFFLTCRIESEGGAFTLERLELDGTPETYARCAAFFEDMSCGEMACEDGGACATDPDRLACAELFGGINGTVGNDDDDDDNDNDRNFDGYDDGDCLVHEDCPAGSFCQLPRYDEDLQRTQCSACVDPLPAGALCQTAWSAAAVVPCEDGFVCAPNWDSQEPTTCTPPRAEGEGCIFDTDCEGGFCVPAIARCHDGGFEGDSCEDDPRKCRDGLTCIANVCVEEVPLGGACTLSDECANDFCDPTAQVCGTPNGGACSTSWAERCQTRYCDADTLTCDDPPPPKGEGEPCTSPSECEQGLACDGTCFVSCTSEQDCPGERCDWNTSRCVPRAENGTSCETDEDCVSGYCHQENEVCTDPPAEGSSCSGYDCGPALTCVNGACAERAGPGESCSGYDGCMSPYMCMNGVCELFPLLCEPAPRGERCAALSVCEDDSFCDASASFTCAARKDRGDDCIGWPEEECGAGLYCATSTGTPTCAPRAAVGEDCTMTVCTEEAACVEGTCVVVPGGGAPCTWNEDCPPELFCADRDEVCVPRRGEGEGCDDNDAPCLPGLRCDWDTNECVALPGVGGSCDFTGCAPEAWCNQTVCEARGEEGDACASDSTCLDGLLCSGDVCAPRAPVGGSCWDDDDCASDLCDRRVQRCVEDDQCVEP